MPVLGRPGRPETRPLHHLHVTPLSHVSHGRPSIHFAPPQIDFVANEVLMPEKTHTISFFVVLDDLVPGTSHDESVTDIPPL